MPRLDKQDQMRIAKRRMEVARLYLQGKAQIEIADKMDMHPSAVYADLEAIRREWVERALMDFDQRKAEELAKLDRLEAICYEAWFRSCEDARIMRQRLEYVRQRGEGKRKKARLIPVARINDDTTKGQAGDPRFTEQIFKCIELRMKVFGMFRGDTVNQNVMNIDFGSLVGRSEEPDEAERRIAEVKHLTAITSTPKHLEVTEDLSPEQEIERRIIVQNRPEE